MLYVDDIFVSIQGESTDTGLPCVFVRLYGCNVKCSYCDQPQEPSNRKRMSIERIMATIHKLKAPYVCITGGEPLIQPEVYSLVYELLSEDYKVSIETNGCVPIEECGYRRSYKFIMDVKCPSSGVSHRNVYENLGNLLSHDEVKFVIADENDYKFALKTLRTYHTKAQVLFSPMFDKEGNPVIAQQLVDWMLRDRLHQVRIQIQIHKILNVK